MSNWTDAEDRDEHDHGARPPVTAPEIERAAAHLAQLTHVTEQAEAASRNLGALLGAFAIELIRSGLPESMVEELTHHYLERLLPGPPA